MIVLICYYTWLHFLSICYSDQLLLEEQVYYKILFHATLSFGSNSRAKIRSWQHAAPESVLKRDMNIKKFSSEDYYDM